MTDDLRTKLTTRRLPEEDVEIPGVATVRVRGLNRTEAVHVQLAGDAVERDRRVLAQGMVSPMFMAPAPLLHSIGDKPCAKCAPIGEWQEAAPAGELEPVSERITILSGLAQQAGKEAYREFEDQPEAEFRVLPGGGTVDDGSPPA